jgi:ERCC4-related helicase
MPTISPINQSPSELVLGVRLNARVPEADQLRQRAEVDEILRRLRDQPGVILADEVGMGKTFVALAVAYSVAIHCPRGPVIVMVPANLVDKWEQDLKTFCELYLDDRHPVLRNAGQQKELTSKAAVRYGVARHSVELMKLLDDPRSVRCHLIFLAQGAMSRRQTDKWIRLALIAEALRRHGRGKASRLIQVKNQIHRFLGELLWAIGEERAHDWGDELWQDLLRTDPATWKDTYNEAVRDNRRKLTDDPVPKAMARALSRIDLKLLAEALEQMPVRARGNDVRLSQRLNHARTALRQVEQKLWSDLLAQARWRSPLLVMDEAHHLKNPGTTLARQLQSPDLEQDPRTGDGAMANAFDRMLFLTATPFQLGHHELVHVLKRFGDVRWDASELGDPEAFHDRLLNLGKHLNDSQRTAIALQRAWCRLRPEDHDYHDESWWLQLVNSPREQLNGHQRAVVDAFLAARRCREAAQLALRPWIVRHNKGAHWVGTGISRRQRLDGVAIMGKEPGTGLPIPPSQLLPFFLAARSTVSAGQDLLGEALCSSYEAFRFTRQDRGAAKDDQEHEIPTNEDLAHSRWYLSQFDSALQRQSGSTHPKISATVRSVVDLWERGEKVLVFAFYRQTCRALRIHISQEIERRVIETGRRRLVEVGCESEAQEIEHLLDRIQKRYFDDADSPGRHAVTSALDDIMRPHAAILRANRIPDEQLNTLTSVMRRFLRVSTTLVRCFPIGELDAINPTEAVARMLDHADGSGVSWRQKLNRFIDFLTIYCSSEERKVYLEAAQRTQTGGIRVEDEEDDEAGGHAGRITLANVQVATGTTKRKTRARLMRAFNTPFFPDVLVCSRVMGEGVDLQRFCRHVIHHDLDWNPSAIEQRTGRIDRLGCKAEGSQPIMVYLPYLAGAADERQYQVMSDRERWFRVVMGQDEVARLISSDSSTAIPLPEAISEHLSFKLGLDELVGV